MIHFSLQSILRHDPASIYFLTFFIWYRWPDFTHAPHVRSPPLLLRRLRHYRLKARWISSLSTANNWLLLFLFSSILLSAARPLMFSTCFRSSSLIADSFDDRSRFGQGLSRWWYYLKATGLQQRYTKETEAYLYFLACLFSLFWLVCCLGFTALVLSTTLLSVRTLL